MLTCYLVEKKYQHCGINGKFHFCLFDFLFKADEISHVIAELEKSIARYKEEYAALISQAQAIKADLAAVEAKVILRNWNLYYRLSVSMNSISLDESLTENKGSYWR